jgi:hypothetical protein
MQISSRIQLVAQIIIGCFCVGILISDVNVTKSKAQLACNGQPPTWGTPPSTNAWLIGPRTITVKIFDYDTNSYNLIKEGVEGWNAQTTTNCSSISFGNFSSDTGYVHYAQEQTPNETIWVYRRPYVAGSDPANMDNEYAGTGSTRYVRAGRIPINDIYVASVSGDYLKYLGAHEPGHSLGLLNQEGTLSNVTVMGTSRVPTTCDRDAVKKVYCPATPTPTPTPTLIITVITASTTGTANGPDRVRQLVTGAHLKERSVSRHRPLWWTWREMDLT